MKALISKMGLERISRRESSFLLLLLLMFLLYGLRLVLPQPEGTDPPCPEPMYVQVEGDILTPGVYAFCSQPTLKALIRNAGGLKQGTGGVPLEDRFIVSGTKVILLFRGKGYEVSQSEMSAFHKYTLGVPISLNRETEEGLTAIPGIGPNLARAIVEERTRRGGFKALDELRSVPGMGERLHARMRPHLTL